MADRLAACVQILGPVSSTYHWQDRVERNEEWMCVIKTTVEPERIEVVWVGDTKTTDVAHDLVIPDADAPDAVEQVKRLLQEKGIIFRPW